MEKGREEVQECAGCMGSSFTTSRLFRFFFPLFFFSLIPLLFTPYTTPSFPSMLFLLSPPLPLIPPFSFSHLPCSSSFAKPLSILLFIDVYFSINISKIQGNIGQTIANLKHAVEDVSLASIKNDVSSGVTSLSDFVGQKV